MTDPFISPLRCWSKHTAAFSSALLVPFEIGLKLLSHHFSFFSGEIGTTAAKVKGFPVGLLRNGKCFLPHVSKTYMFLKKQGYITQICCWCMYGLYWTMYVETGYIEITEFLLYLRLIWFLYCRDGPWNALSVNLTKENNKTTTLSNIKLCRSDILVSFCQTLRFLPPLWWVN